MAAHDRGFAFVEPAWRFRQPRLAADQTRPLGGEAHFKIAFTGNGAQADADGALERLGRSLLRSALRLDIGGHSSFPSPRRRGEVTVRKAPRSPTIPAIPVRSSADRTRQPAAVPVRRIY